MAILRFLPGLLIALLLAVWPVAGGAQDFVPVPPLTAHVTDQAGMLTAQQRAALENVLSEYEQRTGSQIAVLLVDKTAPEAIEQYGIRVFDAWKLGRKGVDDGVLLLVAKNNPPALRRLRIEAGRGVQGVLTDAQSKRILQDVIAPYFRQNDFYGGLTAGVSAIASLLDQEHFAAPQEKKAGQREESESFPLAPLLILVILFLLLSRARTSRRWTHTRGDWGRSSGIILGGWGSGGWRDGGFGSGGFGGSGGGFSGGGGSADGGGASGNW